jgi:hypothetical protein
MKFIIDVPEEFKDLDGTLSIPCKYYGTIDASFRTGIKLEEYKEKGEVFKIGDEVEYYIGDNRSIKFVIFKIDKDDDELFGISLNKIEASGWSWEYCDIDEARKTGRYFPQIEDLLREMEEK